MKKALPGDQLSVGAYRPGALLGPSRQRLTCLRHTHCIAYHPELLVHAVEIDRWAEEEERDVYGCQSGSFALKIERDDD